MDGDFPKDGDSGSFVIPADRDVAGILFSDVTYEGNPIGVAMNMPDVVESMELRLNHSDSPASSLMVLCFFCQSMLITLLYSIDSIC